MDISTLGKLILYAAHSYFKQKNICERKGKLQGIVQLKRPIDQNCPVVNLISCSAAVIKQEDVSK